MCIFYRTIFYECCCKEGVIITGTLHVRLEILQHVFVEAKETLGVCKEREQLLLVQAVDEALLEVDHLPKRLHVGLLCRDHLPVDPPTADTVLLPLLRGVSVLCHDLVDVRALSGLGLVLCD